MATHTSVPLTVFAELVEALALMFILATMSSFPFSRWAADHCRAAPSQRRNSALASGDVSKNPTHRQTATAVCHTLG